MVRLIAWALLVSLINSPLHAQRRNSVRAGVHVESHCGGSPAESVCERTGVSIAPSQSTESPWAVLLSAILPGSGQAMTGSSRAFPYLAIEAFAWSAFVRHSLQYRRSRNGYRDLAASVARAPFSAVRPHGDFEYYEHMTHFLEAGRYDLVAGGVLEPETDTTTYNGAMWLLARRTYWPDASIAPATTSPEWMRAIAFYESRAYDQLYRWSWTSAPLEYSAFLKLIGESNDANRRGMVDLGIIIANHVLSTVDAYVTLRLRHDARRRELGVMGQLLLPRVLR